MPDSAGRGGTPSRIYRQGDAEMMSMMTRRTVLPFLLGVAVLAMVAALTYWQPAPAAAQEDEPETPAAPKNLRVTARLAGAPYYVPEVEYRLTAGGWERYTVPGKTRLVCPRTVVFAQWDRVPGEGTVSYVRHYRRTDSDLGENVWTEWGGGVMGGGNRPVGAIPNIVRGETYEVRVAAVVGGVQGEYAYAKGHTHVDEIKAPTNLSAQPLAESPGRVELSWENPGDNTTALVGVRKSGESLWNEGTRRINDPDAPLVLVSGLDADTRYEFRVIHVNQKCAFSEPSGVAEAHVAGVTAPGLPDYTATVNYGTSSPSLVVTPQNVPAGVTSYTLVYRVKDSGDEFTEVTATRSNALSGISVGGLSHGATYRVGLRATNANGDGEYAYRDVTVSALADPPAFTVTPDYADNGVSLTVKVTTPVAGAVSYALRVNGTTTTVAAGEFSGGGHSVSASLGTAYTVAVATVNNAGQGAFSADQSLTTLSLPSAPSVTAVAQYSGNSASILVTVAPAAAAEQLQGYQVRHRKVSDDGSQWSAESITPAAGQAGYSFDADLGASYAIEVSGRNAAGQGAGAALAVSVKTRPDAPDFTAEVVYANGAATVRVKVPSVGSDVLDYSVRYRASATDSWTATTVTTAQAQSGWSFTAEPGSTYSVEVAARTEVGLGGYGAATVSIVERVGAPEFTVTVSRSESGAVARVAVSNAQQQAQYHMFSMGDAEPVKAAMPDADHEFAVVLGNTYRFGVAAGNQLGTGEYAYRDITALVVPDAPSFTLAPVYHNGSAYLAVQVANPDPHASRYLLKVGDAEAAIHTDMANLRVPVVPGETYTVALAAGNAAGDSAYTTVTRSTTTVEYEALLEWRLILPDHATPGEAVGAATQYVAIVNGAPEIYDPVPSCMSRETARARADLARATALAGWVDEMADASDDLRAYATLHQTAMATALTAVETAAQPVCEARYPTAENLGDSDARWVRLPR